MSSYFKQSKPSPPPLQETNKKQSKPPPPTQETKRKPCSDIIGTEERKKRMFPSFASAYGAFFFNAKPSDEGLTTGGDRLGLSQWIMKKSVVISRDPKDSVSVGQLVVNSLFKSNGEKK